MSAPSLHSSSASPSSARGDASLRRSGGLARLPELDFTAARVGLEATRHRVITLPAGIVDKATFFAAVRANVPLDPPLAADQWDLLDDSLFEGLLALPDDRIAILWSGAGEMRASDPHAFSVAIQVLENAALSLINGAYTLGPPKSVLVIVDA